MVLLWALFLSLMTSLNYSVLKNNSYSLEGGFRDETSMSRMMQTTNKRRQQRMPPAQEMRSDAPRRPKLPQEGKKPSAAGSTSDNNNYHLVFSSSCSSKDWQSYLFFYLAMEHEQPGDVTHIVSGCEDKETEDEIRKMHEEQHTRAMNRNFLIHFTQEFSDRKDFQTTKYWNKPFGLKDWLEHRFGFEYDESKGDVANPTDFDDDVCSATDCSNQNLLDSLNAHAAHDVAILVFFFLFA